MGRLSGTKTLGNLFKAFVGESQARMRYVYYSKVARNDGYGQISEIFLETAENETQHGKQFYRYIAEEEQGPDGQPIELHVDQDAAYPVALTDNTYINLVNAANGEKDEWGTLYPAFADDAEAEGFNDIAATFRAIVDAEMAHEKRYRILAEAVKNGTVFKRPEKVYWRCGDCGYTCFAEEPPERCPVCNNPRRVFRIADIDN